MGEEAKTTTEDRNAKPQEEDEENHAPALAGAMNGGQSTDLLLGGLVVTQQELGSHTQRLSAATTHACARWIASLASECMCVLACVFADPVHSQRGC